MDYIKKEIGSGVALVNVPVSRFKTNEIAVCLATPISEKAVSANALLIGLLSRKSKDYPDMKSLNRRLCSLYGASALSSVSKLGEYQVLKLGITCLDDRFSLDSSSISYECVKLLLSLLFEPKLDENGRFFKEDIEAEKRILIEKISSEENEKRVYALKQSEAVMFKDEPYGIYKYGSVKKIQELTCDDIYNAWQNLLSCARIMVSVVGNTDTDKTDALISSYLSRIERSFDGVKSAVFVPESKTVKNETERIDVKQGKLVLGFRVNVKPEDDMTSAMRVFCDVFGGGPYSKLFANVREKMSLCYYCSARYNRLKSCIMVQCGCEEENMDKALNEILAQLDEIKKGNFDEEFTSSKMALCDAFASVTDSPEVIESWYETQLLDEKIKEPTDVLNEVSAVTKEQVQECAQLVSLDTVYRLTALKEEAE